MRKEELLKKVLPMYLNHGISGIYARPNGNTTENLTIDFLKELDCSYSDKSNNYRLYRPYLKPLSDLTKDRETLYDIAIIAGCHFKERMQVKDYNIYQEDWCQVCEVSWSDSRNEPFEISWSLKYRKGLDERNGNVSLSSGSGNMVFNTNRIFELLYSKGYDVERLIEQGFAIDINSIDK